MAEPVLKLVIPEPENGHGQANPWRTTSKPSASEVAPREKATNGATITATNTAATGATDSVVGPEPGATNGTAEGATNPAAETTAGPALEVADGADTLPTIELAGRPMTAGEKAARLARHWAASVREDAMRPGELVHAAVHGRPESVAEIHAYALSRAWVPEGYEGWALPFFGAAYSHTIAKGGTVLGCSIAWVTARVLRLAVFLLVAGVLTVLIIAFG